MSGPVRTRYQVIIAGAGPAGAGTAARLVQRDPSLADRILVLDRCHFPRAKPCGGGLTGHALDALRELDLALDVPSWPSPGAQVRFGAFRRAVALPRPVHVVRREDFDASLVAQVRARGVEVVEGEAVDRAVADSEAVHLVTSRGRQLEARVLVGADGAASVVRKQLAGGARAVPHRLFKLEMPVPPTRPVEADMLYDFSLMARGLRGYLWIFPVPGERLNVGLMHYPSRRLGGAELTSLLRDGLAEHGLSLPERGTRGWPAWGYHPRTPVAGPRMLTVGDAAGIDGLTGEGIAVALEHAVVAGDTVVEALGGGDLAFAGYRRRLRRATVGRELALDRWLARLLYGGQRWRGWLSLVLFDPEVLELYAARVAGTAVLADQKGRLYRALGRHLVRYFGRRRALAAALPRPGEVAGLLGDAAAR